MKKLIYSAMAATMLLATSCQDDMANSFVGEEATVEFNISTPEIATRAYSVADEIDHLHYAVYEEDGTITQLTATEVPFDKLGKSLSLKLKTGKTYQVVFWADDENAPYFIDFENKRMSIVYTNQNQMVCNNEKLDAFYYSGQITVEGNKTIGVTLTRPFAQINVVTNDYEDAKKANYIPTQSEIKVKSYTTLNLWDGSVDDEVELTYAYSAIPTVEFESNNIVGYKYIAMSYVLMGSNEAVDVTFSHKNNKDESVRTVGAVPLARNYRTNLYGSLLTSDATVNVGIEAAFVNDYDKEAPVLVATPEELKAAIADENVTEITLATDFTLTETLVFGSSSNNPAPTRSARELVLNLNGKEIKGAADCIEVRNGVKLIIEGNGRVYGDASALWVNGGIVDINGGTFEGVAEDQAKGGCSVVFVGKNGTANIYGGSFKALNPDMNAFANKNGVYAALNIADNNGTINVYGGSFYKQNPAAAGTEPAGKNNFVAEGYNVQEEGDWYHVVAADGPTFVTTAETLATALKSDQEIINVKLGNNIDLPISSLGQITGGSGEYKLGGENTRNITIDLNGNKLNVTTTYWSVLGAKNDNAVFTIKNGTMTSSQTSGTWNSYDLAFANCNYNFENVVFDKAIALEAANKVYNLKNIKIKETHDYYAMWVSAKGQTINIDGLTINSDGRGIKIDEQYVDNAANVKLNINNAKFTTNKKAAIVVKSVAGATINASNLDIKNVKADQYFAVWVDEDSKAYADKVIVNGAYKSIEGESAVVDSDEKLSTAIKEGKTSILLANGNYTMPGISNKNVTIAGSRDAVITINKPNMSGSNITFDGLTVKGSGYATGVQHVNTVTYNNVKVVGEMCLYGEKVAFNNCEFELNNQYVWTYGAKEAEFKGCTFNTIGKAILVYNEGAGANNVVVNDCTFNATAGAKAGAIANQNCAAIEIDNFQSSGTGAAHKVTTSGNRYGSNFSGEWRIKNYVAGNPITVNGKEYTQIALDGKLMTIDSNKNVTVQ